MEPAGTLERGVAVLRALAAEPARRTRATDLVRATGLARSTVDRVLATLAHLGYVRMREREVVLAPRLMELGEAYLACGGLRDLLSPFAEALAEQLDESVSLAVPDGDGVRFVGQFTRRRTMSVAFEVGDRLPADRCAAGLALREPAGWAEDDQLIEPGLVAVAVPVRDPAGRRVCAVSVVSHTSRHTATGLRDHALPVLRETVAKMETALTAPAATGSAPRVDPSRGLKEELGAAYLQSLARGLAVLVSLGSAAGGLSLADAAKVTGLPRATVRRALMTLGELGYAAGDGRWVLLPRVLDLGYAHLSGFTFTEVVQPHLADLVAAVGESASAAVLAGDDVVYVARVPTKSIMSVTITVGTRFPAYATSMGRVLLADRPEEEFAALEFRPLTKRTITSAAELAAAVRQVARDGYAVVDQELEEGVRSIAVPVRDRTGRVVAAVNVATHASRVSTAGLLRDILPALRRTAARIEADLVLTRVTP
ncbi:IclR family transcriptional regulator, pca regulon regulatory protein [Nonomuraea solani]|uniref:IclR family transcriptional regulator, pca regulon regulatory protein n=1 Tax=Nonomuraea solani TaxID=1144553 RepID=A0A1H6EG41_9ACTN|nr:IclR family transcriptional regulator C-terminal domain-containing protein [Nonomuraea solani]SEG96777.1 IclR family transcriptional regulator, pca regulon regulatory protein [Nonomuraea solani]